MNPYMVFSTKVPEVRQLILEMGSYYFVFTDLSRVYGSFFEKVIILAQKGL